MTKVNVVMYTSNVHACLSKLSRTICLSPAPASYMLRTATIRYLLREKSLTSLKCFPLCSKIAPLSLSSSPKHDCAGVKNLHRVINIHNSKPERAHNNIIFLGESTDFYIWCQIKKLLKPLKIWHNLLQKLNHSSSHEQPLRNLPKMTAVSMTHRLLHLSQSRTKLLFPHPRDFTQ